MKYDKYSIDDFLTDKEFIKWVKNPSRESNLFWSRWIKEHQEKKETVLEAIQIIRSINFREEKVEYEQIINNLDRIISSKSGRDSFRSKDASKIVKLFNKRFYWIAASLLLIISIVQLNSFFHSEDQVHSAQEPSILVTKSNPKGQKSTFILPDSTIVILNAESELTYRENFTGDTRVVFLEGEAFFDIHENIHKPFVVNSGTISTRALGTSFNVRAFRDEETISVSLSSGQVAIENEEPGISDKIYLYPGEKYIYNTTRKEDKKIEFEPNEDLAWKDGILFFRQASLDEFILSIERWYGVKVSVIGAPEKDWKINGRFKNESLRNVLESLNFARQLEYTMKGKEVVLLFN